MAISRRRRVLRDIAEFFAKEGRIPSEKEYNKLKDRPHTSQRIRRVVGHWGRVLRWIEKYEPELYEQALNAKEVAKAEANAKAVKEAAIVSAKEAAEKAKAEARAAREARVAAQESNDG